MSYYFLYHDVFVCVPQTNKKTQQKPTPLWLLNVTNREIPSSLRRKYYNAMLKA